MRMDWFVEALWQRDQAHPHFERNDATQRLAETLLRDASCLNGGCNGSDNGCQAIRLDGTFHDVIARKNGSHACLGDRLRRISIALLLHELEQAPPIHRVGNHDSLVAQLAAQDLIDQHRREP